VKIFQASVVGWSCFPDPAVLVQGCSRPEANFVADGLDLNFIPSNLRRRCSPLSRVTLAVAFAAARGRAQLVSLPTIFSSAHGESDVTAALLKDLAAEQALSPMGFSLSVHNASSGLFSIATGDLEAATALAAGEHSLLMGLCESLLTLTDSPDRPVLYVCYDDRVPEAFVPAARSADVPFALGVVLGPQGMKGGCDIQIEISQAAGSGGEEPSGRSTVAPTFSFVRWLTGEVPSVLLSDESNSWQLSARTSLGVLFTSPVL
jgi:hypothetical protein